MNKKTNIADMIIAATISVLCAGGITADMAKKYGFGVAVVYAFVFGVIFGTLCFISFLYK